MTRVENGNKPSLQRWQHMTGIFLAMCFGACTPTPDESDPDGVEDLATETDEEGAVVELSEPESTDTSSPEDTAGELAAAKAGCVHIRYCDQGGFVICATNDAGSCSPSDRWAECKKDADYVCGKDWKKMRFVPKLCFKEFQGDLPKWKCYDKTTR